MCADYEIGQEALRFATTRFASAFCVIRERSCRSQPNRLCERKVHQNSGLTKKLLRETPGRVKMRHQNTERTHRSDNKGIFSISVTWFGRGPGFWNVPHLYATLPLTFTPGVRRIHPSLKGRPPLPKLPVVTAVRSLSRTPGEVKIMKRVVIKISLLLIVAATASLIPGREQEARRQQPPANGAPYVNPLKVALLKWYPANLTTSFKVGKSPLGVAFDGANIWVANQYGSSVTKLRASDGETLGTFPTGAGPTGVVFDGANIWTVNSLGNTVTKLLASDGKTLGTFPLGDAPLFAAFDGQAIWVTNSQDASITKLRVSDGKMLGCSRTL